MITKHRQARDYLSDSSLNSFWTIVKEAKISDDDQRVLDLKFIKGWSHGRISRELHMSVDNVNKIVGKAYDKIAKLITCEVKHK